MKVLSITNFNIGHAATFPEISLFKGLQEKGVDLTVVISSPTPKSKELESFGIKLVYIPFKRKIDLLAIRLLRALIIENKYDIIHLTYSKAISNCLLAVRGTSSKLVAYIGSTSVHWHDPMAYLSFLNPRISRIICLSNGVQEHFLKQAPRRLMGKTVRIYKGYDPEWFSNVKPADRNEAIQMLKKLSGCKHVVYTGVCIKSLTKEITFVAKSSVYFDEISKPEIEHYIDTYKPYDKAGAYGVQEWIGYVAVKKIKGSFYNVMGFPIHQVYIELKKFLND